jgi:hypothetical protein
MLKTHSDQIVALTPRLSSLPRLTAVSLNQQEPAPTSEAHGSAQMCPAHRAMAGR